MSWKSVAGFLLLFAAGPGMLNSARAAELETYKEANNALRNDLVSGNAPAGMRNSAYAKQVTNAFDLAVTEIAKDKPIADVLEICGEASKTKVQFLLFGLKQELANTPEAEKVARTLQVEEKNMLRFQDEFTAALRFDIACLAALAGKLDAFSGQLKASDLTPARRAGMQQLQKGMVDIVSGLALNQLDDIRAENRQILLDALVHNIDPYAAAMTKEGRRTAVASIEEVLKSPAISTEAKEKLRMVEKALNRTDCGPSCSFQ